MLEQFRRWFILARERRALAQLDDRALHDIGISRAEADEEARRPFWDDVVFRPSRDEGVRAPRAPYRPAVRFTRVPE
jgi:uncharacterized protein YjiS (DUF1127 family)